MKPSFFKIITLFFCTFIFPTLIYGNSVLVSISPHKYFIERIVGDTLSVEVMVPPGANAHTFEPTPRQVVKQSNSTIWFQIGEGFEKKSGEAIKAHNPSMMFVNLQKSVDLIYEHSCPHCTSHSFDPHTWLSPRRSLKQVEVMIQTLSEKFPEHQELFSKNGQKLTDDLKALDQDITQILQPVKGRSFLVSHPAYAYFAKDYGLQQLSIEFEGKDPSPRQITNILREAKSKGIRTVFIQVQFNNKGACLVAKELGASVVTLDPYGEDYIKNMLETAHHMAHP